MKKEAHIEMKKYFEEKRRRLETAGENELDDEDMHLAVAPIQPPAPAPAPVPEAPAQDAAQDAVPDAAPDAAAVAAAPAPTPAITVFDLPAGAGPSNVPDGFTIVNGTDGKSYLIETEVLKKI